jgi:hypothetical protein
MKMEALQKLDKLLNKTQNLPTPTIDSHSNAATPTATTQHNMPQTRVKTTVPMPTPMETSQPITPQPRVEMTNNEPLPRVQEKVPPPRVKENRGTPSAQLQKLRSWINNNTNGRARLQQQNQMNLRQPQCMQAQLVHDTETGDYLNYRQLLRNPKHKEVWERSAANEFG